MNKNKINKNLIIYATYLSLLIGFFIFCVKLYAWVITESVSILGSLVDSGLDISASLINMLAIRYSFKPTTDKRRFGFDKLQDLAVFAQSAFFCVSGIFIVLLGISGLFNSETVNASSVGIYAMIISMIATFALVAFQTFVLSKSQSNVILADRIHYLTDFATNLGVILSIYLSSKFPAIDKIFGVAIGIYLFYSSIGLFKKSFENLTDHEFDDENKAILINVLSDFKSRGKIINVHDIKTRVAGLKKFIQFHIELDGNKSLYKVHEISEEILKELTLSFPESEIMIHQDPAGIEEDVEYKDKI